ncbi:MAG: glycerate kinase type-2 family protein [Gemmatimonadaceae bacterium]
MALSEASKVVSPRKLLEHLFRTAVDAADPRGAVREAVSAFDFKAAPAIIAIGKGAPAMAAGALQALGARELTPRVGLVVSDTGTPAPLGPLRHLAGSHPVPDERSFAAAAAMVDTVVAGQRSSDVLVLLSGGTTSLIAHPVAGIPPEDIATLFGALLGSGARINEMNVIRRRVLQWGGGRLALALAPARVRCLIVSDVLGNDLPSIGSGPCVGDPATVAEVRDVVSRWRLPLPPSVSAYLARVAGGAEPETPKPGDSLFQHVETRILLENATAVAAARREVQRLGLGLIDAHGHLEGEAARCGRAVGVQLGQESATLGGRRVLVVGGETTVTLRGGAGGSGGRCQELALAAADMLREAALGERAVLLAAGTDGRDGPTDAAGALVDGTTWTRVHMAGRDPARDLDQHNAYHALDSVGALFRTGPTGTNVNDLVIAVVDGAGSGERTRRKQDAAQA